MVAEKIEWSHWFAARVAGFDDSAPVTFGNGAAQMTAANMRIRNRSAQAKFLFAVLHEHHLYLKVSLASPTFIHKTSVSLKCLLLFMYLSNDLTQNRTFASYFARFESFMRYSEGSNKEPR